MYSQVCVLLCLFVAGCYGFYGYRGNGGNSRRRAVCSSSGKPCRIQVTMSHFNGTEVSQMETEMCSCNGRGNCPTDWNNDTYVVSRQLISHNYNMVFKMIFCKPIQPARYCDRGDNALVVSGHFILPTSVDEYNCRCRGDVPLQLHRSSYKNLMKVHEYVCDYYKQSCFNSTEWCMKIRDASTYYRCKCQSGQHCKAPENSNNRPPIYGYCRT